MKKWFTLRTLLSSAFALTVCVSAASSANAQAFAFDGFEIGTGTGQYTAGVLETQAPVIAGFTGGWTNAANANVVAAGLDFDDANYFDEIGGSINVPDTPSNNGRQGRLLSTPYDASFAGTVYLSFLMQTDIEDSGSYRAFELHEGGFNDAANRRFQVGFQNGDFNSEDINYGFNASGSGGIGATALSENDGLANLFVIKFEFSADAASDSVTVWQNPDLTSGTDPAGGITETGLDVAFDRITFAKFGDSNGASWDEIRFGETFADVATDAVPTEALCGDIDRSGTVNFADISPFIAVLSSGEFQAEADCNGDEMVTFADIAPFISALSSQ